MPQKGPRWIYSTQRDENQAHPVFRHCASPRPTPQEAGRQARHSPHLTPPKPASFPVEDHQSDNTQDRHRLVPLTRCNQSSHIQIWLSTRQGCMVRSTGTQEPKEEFLYIRHIVLFSMDSSSSSTNSKSQCRSPSHYIKISTIFTVFPLLFFPTQVFVDRLTIDEI